MNSKHFLERRSCLDGRSFLCFFFFLLCFSGAPCLPFLSLPCLRLICLDFSNVRIFSLRFFVCLFLISRYFQVFRLSFWLSLLRWVCSFGFPRHRGAFVAPVSQLGVRSSHPLLRREICDVVYQIFILDGVQAESLDIQLISQRLRYSYAGKVNPGIKKSNIGGRVQI